MPTGRSPFNMARNKAPISTKLQIAGDDLGSKTSVDFTKIRGAMQMPTQQSREISRFKKFSFMEELTIFRAIPFDARIKNAPEYPNT